MVSNRLVKLAVIAMALPVASWAETFYIKLDATDFSQPGSYTNSAGVALTTLPGASDVVELPANGKYTVACGSESFDAINGFGRISPSAGSVITFTDTSADSVHTLACPVTCAVQNKYDLGELVKEGPGRLVLGALNKVSFSGASYDYHTAITVKEGTLSGCHFDTDKAYTFYYGILSISNNATFAMPGSSAKSGSFTTIRGLNGGGMITNDLPQSQSLHPYPQKLSEAGWFTGTIGGSVLFTGSGPINLAGTNSTFGSSMQTKLMGGSATKRVEDGWGIIGVMSFGAVKNTPSSIGKQEVVYTYTSSDMCGGGYKYLGEGETTAKHFKFRSVNGNSSHPYQSQPAVLDGGLHGGLNFTGRIQGYDAYPMALIIRGTNAAPCIVNCPVYDWSASGVVTEPATAARYPLHIKKIDPGVWEFRGNAEGSTHSGAWTIEEGTVRFSSVGEVGEKSALGTATNLLSFGVGSFTAPIDWAISLGGTDRVGKPCVGTLEYIGAGDSSTTTRKMVLAGDGRLMATGAGSLRWSGIEGLGEGARTLILDGTATSGCAVGDVRDGAAAPVSIKKDGTGDWTVAGELGFSGPVAVNNGRLTIENPDRYGWYRLSAREYWGTSTTSYYLQLKRIALYSADGEQQNVGLVENSAAKTDVTKLGYGEVTVECERYDCVKSSLTNFFIAADSPDSSFCTVRRSVVGTGAGIIPVLTETNTWLNIVMRLPKWAKKVTKYDIQGYILQNKAVNDRDVKSWTLQGSQDGKTWVDLHTVISNSTPVTAQYQWYGSLSTTFDLDNAYPGNGSSLATPPGVITKTLGQTSVAGGATLEAVGAIEVDNLLVDYAGAGTFEGVTFAESGNVCITNVPAGIVNSFVPVTFTGCEGASNLAGWTFLVNGKAARSHGISFEGNGFRIASKGLSIIIR